MRIALFGGSGFDPLLYCHRPIIVREESATLGEIIPKLKVHPERLGDDVIDKDIIPFLGHSEAHHYGIRYFRSPDARHCSKSGQEPLKMILKEA